MFNRLSLLKKTYKLIAIYLCEQQKLDVDPNAKEQINFTGNLSRVEGATIFLLLKNQKKQL